MAWLLGRENVKQQKWILDYLEWQTYGRAETIWEKWIVLGGDDMINLAPLRPSPDQILFILKKLCKKGLLVEDPHHYGQGAYFHRARKEVVWQHYWDEKRRRK